MSSIIVYLQRLRNCSAIFFAIYTHAYRYSVGAWEGGGFLKILPYNCIEETSWLKRDGGGRNVRNEFLSKLGNVFLTLPLKLTSAQKGEKG